MKHQLGRRSQCRLKATACFHPAVLCTFAPRAWRPPLLLHTATGADPQSRLNITEIAMPAASAAPAAAPAATEAPAEEEKPKEKTIFTVKLEKIDAAQKAKVIREVKAMMPNMNLVEVSRHSL